MKKLTTTDFIKRSIEKHNNKYSYEFAIYINSKTKIKILCKEHGLFEQLPTNHLSGSGCPDCSGNKKLTLNSFIQRADILHNNKYNYILVKFDNNDSKIDIICPKHGQFTQVLENHLRGHGCGKCNYDNRRTGLDEFIIKSNLKHNNIYDYSLVDYKDINYRVKIICKEHGVFEKIPKSHIKGEGCITCSIKNRNNSYKISYDDFLKKSNLIHDNKYDYSLIEYTSSGYKIDIICPKHGLFSQRANDHQNGVGCPTCGSMNFISKAEKRWLDSLGIENEYRQVKIGKYTVDAYIPETNTIYEFNGDFWHGNPNIFDKNDINRVSMKSYGELYNITINKENELKDLGYNVISIWENDFYKSEKKRKNII